MSSIILTESIFLPAKLTTPIKNLNIAFMLKDMSKNTLGKVNIKNKCI